MRHDFKIRFPRALRAVQLADPDALQSRNAPAVDQAARELAERAAAQELEQQERRAVEEVLAGLAQAADGLTSWRNELLGEMQQVAVELATAIAMRVTYDKLQTDRFAIEELVKSVASRLEFAGPIQVRIHSEDLAALNRRVGDGKLANPAAIQLIGDDSLGRGDCIADAGDVSFASYLEEQLNGIRQHLLRNLSDAQIERRKAAAGDRGLRRFPDRRQTA